MRVLDLPVRPRPSTTRRRAQPPYDAVLTADGKRLLEAKAEQLRAVTLPGLLDAVADDPRDAANRAAYDDAAAELRRVEAVLAQAQPIPTQPTASHQICLGDTITVRFLTSVGDDTEPVEEFLLVHPFEAPLDTHRISVTSPLGHAVVGRRLGDTVTFQSPTGTRRVRVLDRRPPT